jgi:hypothetical protein
MKLRNNLLLALATATLFAAPMAKSATFNYNTDDLLLIFWVDTYDSIFYDIGPVTQFLNHTNGYTTTVTNWDPSIVTTYLGQFPGNGGFLSLSFTLVTGNWTGPSRTGTGDAWLGVVNNGLGLTDVTEKEAGSIYDGLNTRGNQLIQLSTYSLIPVAQAGDVFGTNYIVTVPSDSRAYDYYTLYEDSWGSSGAEEYLGNYGNGAVPGALLFYHTGVETNNIIGAFTFDAYGTLTFTAGANALLDATRITDVEYDGVTETDVTFNSKIGVRYELLQSTNLTTPLSSWNVVPGTAITGDGTPQTASDLSATNKTSFYRVESY